MHVAYIDICGHWTVISFYQAPARHVYKVSMHLGKAGCALSLQSQWIPDLSHNLILIEYDDVVS